MKALVIGATGAVGKDLVRQLLADEAFDRVIVWLFFGDGYQDLPPAIALAVSTGYSILLF